MEIRHHDRYPFTALPERPVYDWPGGKRMAFCLCNNIEWFSFMSGLGSDHTLPGAAQTTRNYAWRDYGNRVGLWYLFDLLNDLGLPASHNLNAATLDRCSEIVASIRARVSCPVTTILAAMKGMQQALASLKSSGAPGAAPNLLAGFHDIKDRLGASRFKALGDRFGAGGTGPSLIVQDPDGNTIALKGRATAT